MIITLSPRRIIVFLFLLVVALTAVSLSLNLIRIYMGYETIFGLLRLFDLDHESNLPALFSVSLMFASSVFLAVIALDHRKAGNAYAHWMVLSVVFLYLSFDEAAMIHEMMQEWVRPFIPRSDATIHVWVVPYGLFFILMSLIYFKFWLGLPPDVKWPMCLAGLIYVAGAIGCEMLGSINYSKYGDNSGLEYTLQYTAEEFLEMSGLVIFLYAVLRYMQLRSISVTFLLHPDARAVKNVNAAE